MIPNRSQQGSNGSNERFNRLNISRQGFTLFEVLVAMLLLGMISAMIYSVLNAGIRFSDQGGRRLQAIARESGFLSLLHRQVRSALYDSRKKTVAISSDTGLLRIVTRSPLLYRAGGVVLAVYRFEDGGQQVYYTEKKDFYNIDYGEDYIPDPDEMIDLVTLDESMSVNYDAEAGSVSVEYGGKQYLLYPRCMERQKEFSL